MKKNIGKTDKTLRLLGAALLIILYSIEVVSGTLSIVFLITAAVLIITSFLNFCPIYAVLGKSTCKTKP